MLPFPSPASLCTSESRIQRLFSQNRTSSPLGPFCHQRTSSRTCFCVFRRTCPHERTTLVSTIVSQQMLSDIRGYDVQRQASQSSLGAPRGRGVDSKHPLPPPLARRNPGIPKARSKRISSFVHPALTLRRKGAPSFRPPAPRAGRSGCRATVRSPLCWRLRAGPGCAILGRPLSVLGPRLLLLRNGVQTPYLMRGCGVLRPRIW